MKKATLKKGEDFGLNIKQEEDFSNWYQQLLIKAELIDFTDISGCYVLKPNSFAIWEQIQSTFDVMIKKDGVKNAYFPCLVTEKALKSESDNFNGFVPEVAWITKCGNKDLDNVIALRPTSEAIIYPIFSKWIRSYRDLPVRVNQWCNVVRWEMKRCMPFIRSREFLWQEGHSMFATKEEADNEVYKVLEFYRILYEDFLAIPVTKGKKTDKEKFAGAVYTTTVEAFVPHTGRSIQAATSHSLGQNFSRAFDIKFEEKDHTTTFAWQNSWGLSTRSIGAMIMIHGDNQGLRLPPRIAPTHVVIVPIGKEDIVTVCHKIATSLERVRVRVDESDASPGSKFADSELHGIPVRIEVGARDLKTSSVTVYRRDLQSKQTMLLSDLAVQIPRLLDDIHDTMLLNAQTIKKNRTKQVITYEEFIVALDDNCIALVPFCLSVECENNIKTRTKSEDSIAKSNRSIKSLCRPLDQPVLSHDTKCFGCDNRAVEWCLFGKSY